MHNNISDSDHIFIYMKSILISHLEENKPELLNEIDFIAIKADYATTFYNKLIRKGVDKDIAKKESLNILFENI